MSGYFAALAAQANPRAAGAHQAAAVPSLEQYAEVDAAAPTVAASPAASTANPPAPATIEQPAARSIVPAAHQAREPMRHPPSVERIVHEPAPMERSLPADAERQTVAALPARRESPPVVAAARFTPVREIIERRAQIDAPLVIREATTVVHSATHTAAPPSEVPQPTTFVPEPAPVENRVEIGTTAGNAGAPHADATSAQSVQALTSEPHTTIRIGTIALEVHVPPAAPAAAPAPTPRAAPVVAPNPTAPAESRRRFSPQRHYLRWS